jgi:hypothetical protein
MEHRFFAACCALVLLACAEGEEIPSFGLTGQGSGGAAPAETGTSAAGSNAGGSELAAGGATPGGSESSAGSINAGTGGSGLAGFASEAGTSAAAGSSLTDAASSAEASGDATPKAEAGAPLNGITLLYKCTDGNPNDGQIGPSYRIVNSGGTTVSLADFKVRYFLSDEGKAKLVPDFLYAEVNGGAGYRDIRNDASVTVSANVPAAAGADTIVELAFNAAAGTLTSDQTMTVNFVVHTDGYASNLDESNDYSHDASKTDFGANPKVTLYYKGQLIGGTEP